MIVYGLDILNAEFFLFASCIICAIVSIATGSSWATIATIGIALMAIGNVLTISPGLVAGSIISGAYFGDKMSPLSDTTNLAAAMAETDIFVHIKYMMYTTIPSFLITSIIFLVIGFSFDTSTEYSTPTIVSAIEASKLKIDNLWLFIVPLTVVILIIKKVPAIQSLLIGTILGGLFAIIFQPDIILEITQAQSDFMSTETAFKGVGMAMIGDVMIKTPDLEISKKILNSDGIIGMLDTVFLVICAMCFSGAMQAGGLLKIISQYIIRYAKNNGSLVATTSGTCLLINITTCDQYLSIVVPGRMFKENYHLQGLASENLSRTLEDSGSVTSVLVPWNTCGMYSMNTLKVDPSVYIPYCFFNLISPLMTIIYAYLKIKIKKTS